MSVLKAKIVSELNLLLPEKLGKLGFIAGKSRSITIDGYPVSQFPIKGFSRYASNGDLHLIDVRFDKFGAPKFEFLFCSIKNPEDFHQYGSVDQGDATTTSSVGHRGMLQSSCWRTSRYFCPSVFDRQNDQKIAKFVKQVVDKTGDIENWFISGKVSRLMRTQEMFDDGASILRGYPRNIIFRTVEGTFSVQLDGERKFNSIKDVESFLMLELSQSNREVHFRKYWPWEDIY